MSRVLVTGASGFLGQALVNALIQDGHDVTPLVHRDGALFAARSVTADVTDSVQMRGVSYEGDVIIHAAAARTRPDEGWDGWARTMNVNALGTLHVLELAQRCGIPRMIYCSSSSVYALPQPLPIREDGRTYPAPGPDSIYAASKLMGELLCERSAALEARLSCLCLRFGRLYGPGEPAGRVLADWIVRAMAGQELVVHGNGERSADFLYITDAIQALRLALQGTWERETLNIGSGTETAWRALAETVADVFSPPGHRVAIHYVRDGTRTRCALDIRRASTVLGFHSVVSLRAGLQAWRASMAAPVEALP